MRRVHIDQHQTLPVLCQHVHAVQLRQRESQRVFVGFVGCGWRLRRRIRYPVCGRWRLPLQGRRIGLATLRHAQRHTGLLRPGDPRRGGRGGGSGHRPVSLHGFADRLGQHPVQRPVEKVMNQSRLAKTHFMFGRMHVHVHQCRREVQKQHIGRMATVIKHVLKCLSHRMANQLVAHHAPVDIEMLHITLAARERRTGHPASQPQACRFVFEMQRVLNERRPQQIRQASLVAAAVGGNVGTEHLATVVHQHERHVLAHQRKSFDDLLEMAELGLVGPQELASGRGVVEKVAHRDHSATGQCCRADLLPIPNHLPGKLGTAGARCQAEA